MNERRRDHFAQLLRQERARIIAELERIAIGTPAAVAAGGAVPLGDQWVGQTSGGDSEDEAEVVAHEMAALHDVNEAIRVLRDSPHDYGICERCGRPIPESLLEVQPAARLCGRTTARSIISEIDGTR